MSAAIEVRVKLTFPEGLIRVPVLARLTRNFDVEPNIRRANVEEHQGWIVCELGGEAEAIESAVAWLRGEGVDVDLLGDVLEG
jgi:L-aspartate semialdehyde sulfurtransferase ferredoxin